MSIDAKPRAAVFVDVQNIYYTCRQEYQRQFNYRQFYAQLAEKCDVCVANAYAIDSHNDGQHRFQSALRNIGFDVKLKPYIQRADGSAKGDWDVGITIDVMDIASEVDEVILLSGDGDFAQLLVRIKQGLGATTRVVSVEALTAQALIQSCDVYTPINANDLL
ncbi:NYN domain-containing protein [Alteromonas flava]|uniref:LabA-like NYN domain-containing protein n=1 Tax=Alteromonas flava TaxID=2048003 RepID=UPI000C2932F7|nr:NYN domain-containing protein [Alteromonas flava]